MTWLLFVSSKTAYCDCEEIITSLKYIELETADISKLKDL